MTTNLCGIHRLHQVTREEHTNLRIHCFAKLKVLTEYFVITNTQNIYMKIEILIIQSTCIIVQLRLQ